MNGHLLQNGIVFLQLQTFGGVLAVLGSDVTRGTGHTACLVLGAFQDNLNAITFSFLCHDDYAPRNLISFSFR